MIRSRDFLTFVPLRRMCDVCQCSTWHRVQVLSLTTKLVLAVGSCGLYLPVWLLGSLFFPGMGAECLRCIRRERKQRQAVEEESSSP